MAVKKLVSRYNGKCVKCGHPIQKGDNIEWDSQTRETWHEDCPNPLEPQTSVFEPKQVKKEVESWD